MIDYVIYGKIIIDSIKLLDGTIIENQLGGGGPQGAFGARLWSDSVGLVTRIGNSFPEEIKKRLDELNINTEGLNVYPDLATLHGNMFYNENDYLDTNDRETNQKLNCLSRNIQKMLEKNIVLPQSYTKPKVFHLITEYVRENMVQQALEFRKKGTLFSLEPLIDYQCWKNKNEMIKFLPQADVVSPDWPSASGFADSFDPLRVLKWWAQSGPAYVSVRNGRHGSYVWDRKTDKMWHIPIVEAPRIDPTGCGNGYAGAFCVGCDVYKDAGMAGAMGTVAAAFMVKTPGVASISGSPAFLAERDRYLEMLLDRMKEL
jgi:sugar/nucleoside kinase (ribokinase family)